MRTIFTKRWVGLALAGLVLFVATQFDGWFYARFAADPGTIGMDVFKAFRVMGSMVSWVLIAAALLLHDRTRPGGWRDRIERPLLLVCGIAASALVTEALKLLVRRERPIEHAGANVFRPFTQRTFDTGGLAFPSSHTTVAFAGAFVMIWLFPRTWPVWIVMAVGCGLTRIAERAHFFSDVVGAAIAAGITVWALRRFHLRNEARRRANSLVADRSQEHT